MTKQRTNKKNIKKTKKQSGSGKNKTPHIQPLKKKTKAEINKIRKAGISAPILRVITSQTGEAVPISSNMTYQKSKNHLLNVTEKMGKIQAGNILGNYNTKAVENAILTMQPTNLNTLYTRGQLRQALKNPILKQSLISEAQVSSLTQPINSKLRNEKKFKEYQNTQLQRGKKKQGSQDIQGTHVVSELPV